MLGFTTDTVVFRHIWTRYSRDCPRGSGYCADQGQYYRLVKRFFLCGRKVWTRELDREEIPPHVWINSAIFGSTLGCGWVSKFQAYFK